MEEITKKFKLPAYTKGKSFSDASKAIMKRFEGRTDSEATNTQKALLGRLRDAQEYVKQMQEVPDTADKTAVGDIAPATQNQNFLGGILGKAGAAGAAGAAGGGAGPAGYLAAAQGAAGIGQDIFGKTGVDTSGATASDYKSGGGEAVGGALKGAQAGMAFGPYGAAAGAVLGGVGGLIKAGKHNKDATEANTNNTYAQINKTDNRFALGGPLDPPTKGKGTTDEKRIDTLNNATGLQFTNVNALNDFGGNAGRAPLDMGKFKDKGLYDVDMNGENYKVNRTEGSPYNNAAHKDNMKYIKGLNPDASFDNDFAKGGKMNSYAVGGPKLNQGMLDYLSGSNGRPKVQSVGSPDAEGIASPTFDTQGAKGNEKTVSSLTSEGIDPVGFSQEFASSIPAPTAGKVDAKNSDPNTYLSQALRYAPAAANLGQLLALKKPGQEGLDRINARYKENLTDEEAVQNMVKEQTAGTREAIVGSSGGSGSAARANLLANSLNSNKALSDAYFNSVQSNNNENRTGQQFNLGVAQTNLQQSNAENTINAQNQGNYDTQKSKLIAQLGNDVGAIGKEELFKKYPELMGSDYSWLGKYLKK